jgi:hypothetical protein
MGGQVGLGLLAKEGFERILIEVLAFLNKILGLNLEMG